MEVAHACSRCDNALEAGDLRCAVCGLPSPVLAGGAALARARTTAIRCEACGASVRYVVEAKAPRCAFCGSVTRVETQADPTEEAEAIVPFRVSPFEAKNALRAWLGKRGFFTPSDLAKEATLEELRPLLWPAWACEARAEVSWTADSDAGRGRADWAPHAGQLELDFRRVLIPASRGLTLKECTWLTPRFRLDEAAPPGQELPPGTVAERFEATRSAARRIIVDALRDQAEAHLESGVIPGRRHRNVQVELLLRGLRSRRLALPTYVLAYRYRKKLFRVLVHGQDATHLRGTSPTSGWKVFFTIAGIAAVIAAIVAAVTLWPR